MVDSTEQSLREFIKEEQMWHERIRAAVSYTHLDVYKRQNLAGAPLVDRLERELDVLILDSISVVVWKSLKLAGVDPKRIKSWGRLFCEG